MNFSSGAAAFQKATDLANRGQFPEAKRAFEEAIAADPNFAEAHNGLGMVFTQLGDGAKALSHFHQAFTIKPSLQEAFLNFAQLLLHFSERGFAPTIIKDNLAVRGIITKAKAAWPARVPAAEILNDPSFREVAQNPYLLFYLGATRLRDAEIEQALTTLRAALLSLASSEQIDPAFLTFASTLARQCFSNEYIFSVSPEEASEAAKLLESVAAQLKSGGEIPPHRLVILAAYVPLNSLPDAASLLAKNPPPALQAVLVQQVREPQQEKALGEKLPKLTPVEAHDENEGNPYPRWIVTSTPERQMSFKEYVSALFPHAASRRFPGSNDILVANCGTGSVAASLGQLIRGGKLLATDPSLSRLSYAKRLADMLKLGEVEFGQADAAALPSLGRSFDFVSSDLRHVAEPFVAGKALVSMLRPGGYIQIGLASEGDSETRAFIKERGYGESADDIRRFRADVLALPDSHPMKRAALSPGFYELSEFRDLFSGTHGRATIPRIKQFLAENGLAFIGFEVLADVRQQYAAEFPADPQMTNLDHWQAFEERHPDTFSQTYKLWAQKAA